MINNTIDNFSTSKLQPNDIIFHKIFDTKSSDVLRYENREHLIILIIFIPIKNQVK